MPGTRTSPVMTGAASFLELTLRWIDAVGDVRSDTTMILATATEAQMEAVVAAAQAGSNASIYSTSSRKVWAGAKSKSNALAAIRLSAQDNIVYHAKDANRNDRRSFLPSPIAAVFVADTETPDEGDAEMIAWMDAYDVVWAGTFAGVSLRLTERREINEKVNL